MTKNPLIKLVALSAISVLGLSACVTIVQSDAAEGPFYIQGYTDGCTTSRESAKSFSQKTVQDESLFKIDASYRSGWRQGYQSCKVNNGQIDTDHNNSDF